MKQPSPVDVEEDSLKLVEDFNSELIHAARTFPEKTFGLLDQYRFWSARHLQSAADAFAALRRKGRVVGSKFLIRPALEMAFRLEAVRLNPDMFYCISNEEHRQDIHFLQGKPELGQKEKKWDEFKTAYAKELLGSPGKPTIEKIARTAEMTDFYQSHYRIYCRYTHGALLAITGRINEVTNRADNQAIAVCALVALRNLVLLGASSPNHNVLTERLDVLTKRLDSGDPQ